MPRDPFDPENYREQEQEPEDETPPPQGDVQGSLFDGGAEDRKPRDPKRGFKKRYLTGKQRDQILGVIQTGFGPELACSIAQLEWRPFRNTCEDYPRFAADVRSAIETSRQRIESVEFTIAQAGENIPVLKNALDRIDGVRRFEWEKERAKAEKVAIPGDYAAKVALKVFRICMPFVNPDRLTELQDAILKAADDLDAESKPDQQRQLPSHGK